jgi:geranylgeranyl diphosphate synthase type II
MSNPKILRNLAEETSFQDYLSEQQSRMQSAFEKWLAPQKNRTIEAAAYSLLGKSKRIRPLFCLEACRAFLGADEAAIPAAMALEMVHTYSLIHDDLPSMDNDDLRRGQPTNHKVYGEATAILAGDGLLTAAFEVLAKEGSVNSDIRVNWVQELSEAAGMQGMVLGQQLDMDGLKDASLEDLENLHRRKTGALLAASVVMGAMTAQAPQSTLNILREFALDMGLAFQIRDDILDVIGGAELGKPVLSDEKNQKATYVSLLGLEKAQSAGEYWFDRALKKLRLIDFRFQNRLEELTRFVVERKV